MAELLGPLFVAFPSSIDLNSTKALLAVYLVAVDDIPLKSVKQAVLDFVKGTVPGHGKRFMPTTAELASHARTIRRKTEVPLGMLDFNDPEIQSDPDVIRQRQEAHEFTMKSL